MPSYGPKPNPKYATAYFYAAAYFKDSSFRAEQNCPLSGNSAESRNLLCFGSLVRFMI